MSEVVIVKFRCPSCLHDLMISGTRPEFTTTLSGKPHPQMGVVSEFVKSDFGVALAIAHSNKVQRLTVPELNRVEVYVWPFLKRARNTQCGFVYVVLSEKLLKD